MIFYIARVVFHYYAIILWYTEIAELYVVISFAVVSGHRRDCVIAF